MLHMQNAVTLRQVSDTLASIRLDANVLDPQEQLDTFCMQLFGYTQEELLNLLYRPKTKERKK